MKTAAELAYARRWHADHRDIVNARQRARYAVNADSQRARNRLYYVLNRSERIATESARAAVMRVKAKLFDELLPILASGDAKALEKMRRRLVKMSKTA